MSRIKILVLMSVSILLLLQGCGSIVPAYDGNQTTKSTLNNSKDSIDYDSYLKKIWVDENWDGGITCDPISFFITDIKDGMIEGKFATASVAEFDYLLSDFTGTIQDNTADCQFDDKSGNKGNMKLAFIESDKLEVFVEYTQQEFGNKSLNGNYLFQSYTLKDNEKYSDPLKTRSLAINLSWGKANIVTMFVTGYKPYPMAFLANEDGDILQQFNSFQVGSEVKDVLIEDINGDGLEDVKFITFFPTSYSVGDIEWVYFQTESGLFKYGKSTPKDGSTD